MERTERGVMVMKNGKAWGATYDGADFGWMDPTKAPIHDPRYCTKPADVTYKNSPYAKELSTGKIVHVLRTTVVQIDEEQP